MGFSLAQAGVRDKLKSMQIMDTIKKLFSALSKRKKPLFLLLTLASGIFALWPFHNFQYFLAQGDHGRELYCYKKAMDGAVLYRDFSWLYGPFFLYYFGIFLKLFGTTIQSILLAQNLLILSVGVLIYLIGAVFISPALAYICALWYWAYRGVEFFYSYHHSGGLVVILTILLCTLRYARKPRRAYVYSGFAGVLVLILTRLNMGLAIFVAYVLSLFLTDLFKKDPLIKQKAFSYIKLSLLVLAISTAVYWCLVSPLPKYVINQTFPYTKSQLAAVEVSIFGTVLLGFKTLLRAFSANWQRVFLGLALILSIVQFIILCSRKKLPKEALTRIIVIYTCLTVFLIFALHEFIGSGVSFRLNWGLPIFMIIVFYTIYYLISLGPKTIFTPTVNIYIFLVLFCVGFIQISATRKIINSFKVPVQLLHVGETKIYVAQHPLWMRTVTDAVGYMKQHIPEDEKIFSLPHDAIYYFLSGRDGATRQLALFEHTHIPEEQELKIIADLEQHQVRWVVISSRVRSLEFGMGTFGKTHCRILYKYLKNNFGVEAQFGDWSVPAGWVGNHGVQILKRKK